MPVVSTQVGPDPHAQVDGRRYVTETHTLTAGEPVVIEYHQEPGADYNAIAAARVPRINERLAQQEFQQLISDDAPASVALFHQTGEEFADRLRALYRRSSKEVCSRLAWWIYERVAQGQLTQLQIRTAFGMDATQWATFRDTTLIPLHDAWVAVLAAEGE